MSLFKYILTYILTSKVYVRTYRYIKVHIRMPTYIYLVPWFWSSHIGWKAGVAGCPAATRRKAGKNKLFEFFQLWRHWKFIKQLVCTSFSSFSNLFVSLWCGQPVRPLIGLRKSWKLVNTSFLINFQCLQSWKS